jgi:hypothetical protein
MTSIDGQEFRELQVPSLWQGSREAPIQQVAHAEQSQKTLSREKERSWYVSTHSGYRLRDVG